MASSMNRDFEKSAQSGQQRPAEDRKSPRNWPNDKFYRDVNDRTIFVKDLDGYTAHEIVSQLMYFEKTDPGKPITMIINSGGGLVTAAFGIIGVMKTLKSPVHTVAFGDCESMASILLAAGAPGHRKIYPGTRIMIHQPSISKNFGRESEGANLAIDMGNTRRRFERLYLHFMQLPANPRNLELISNAIETDTVLNPGEVRALGLADQIIDVPDLNYDGLDDEARADLDERRDFMELMDELDLLEHHDIDMESTKPSQAGYRAIRELMDERRRVLAMSRPAPDSRPI